MILVISICPPFAQTELMERTNCIEQLLEKLLVQMQGIHKKEEAERYD